MNIKAYFLAFTFLAILFVIVIQFGDKIFDMGDLAVFKETGPAPVYSSIEYNYLNELLTTPPTLYHCDQAIPQHIAALLAEQNQILNVLFSSWEPQTDKLTAENHQQAWTQLVEELPEQYWAYRSPKKWIDVGFRHVLEDRHGKLAMHTMDHLVRRDVEDILSNHTPDTITAASQTILAYIDEKKKVYLYTRDDNSAQDHRERARNLATRAWLIDLETKYLTKLNEVAKRIPQKIIVSNDSNLTQEEALQKWELFKAKKAIQLQTWLNTHKTNTQTIASTTQINVSETPSQLIEFQLKKDTLIFSLNRLPFFIKKT